MVTTCDSQGAVAERERKTKVGGRGEDEDMEISGKYISGLWTKIKIAAMVTNLVTCKRQRWLSDTESEGKREVKCF